MVSAWLASRAISKVTAEFDQTVQADVSLAEEAERALEAVSTHCGSCPTVLVHAVGDISLATLPRTTEAAYRECLRSNLDSAVFTVKAFLARALKEKTPASIILFSSVAAKSGLGNHAAISIAKAGIEALVRSVAADHSAQGIRINAIAPGLMDTPASARFLSNEAGRKMMAAQYPLARIGQAGDAAELVAFLASDTSSWLTGQVLGLDGGFSAVRPIVK